jgi:hypothetical protein
MVGHAVTTWFPVPEKIIHEHNVVFGGKFLSWKIRNTTKE